MPVWRPGRTLYQLHSLAGAGGRGFGALQAWLDHVADLGCGGVLLTPIAESSTHGYDTVDPRRVDPRLGGDDDFDRFVTACHERDLELLLDGVFNHVGRSFPPFVDVCERGRDSEYADWFRIDFDGDGPDGFAYHSFEGHDILVSLNHRSPAVLDWAIGVANHWLDRGVDGWRLDAAYAIPRPFLAAMVDAVRDCHTDAFVFGEVIHGDYEAFVTETHVDSVTQYELHKAIWSSLNDANLFELAWALGRHRGITPVTFVGNHDVTRIASQLADRRHLAAALALLFTLPGVPCVYYGDELGWTGVKEHRAGGDDAIRPPLPPSATGDDEVLGRHRDLIALRRARPWLATAELDVTDVANQRLAYTVRAGDDALDVVIDLADPALYRIS